MGDEQAVIVLALDEVHGYTKTTFPGTEDRAFAPSMISPFLTSVWIDQTWTRSRIGQGAPRGRSAIPGDGWGPSRPSRRRPR